MQGGASSLAVFLETAPPPLYLVYMLAAGFGIPVSTGNSFLRAALFKTTLHLLVLTGSLTLAT